MIYSKKQIYPGTKQLTDFASESFIYLNDSLKKKKALIHMGAKQTLCVKH